MSATDFRQNYFEFAGLDSRDYKIVLSNDNGFDSPERDVEEVVIPGRNGTLILDNGRWKNQTITYNNCFIESSFETYFETLRADICSKLGYQRLEDSFHPNHYRMARLEDVIEPKLGTNYAAGYFDVKFNVKPQRFLKSGETATAVTSGNAVVNPTNYASSPLLRVEGYGTINIGGQSVVLDNVPLGPIDVLNDATISPSSASLDASLYNAGDPLYIGPSTAQIVLTPNPAIVAGGSIISVALTDTGNTGVTLKGYSRGGNTSSGIYIVCNVQLPQMTVTAGTGQTGTHTFDVTLQYMMSGTIFSATASVTVSIIYASGNTLGGSASYTTSGTLPKLNMTGKAIKSGKVVADSSKTVSPIYIDLETGNAWTVMGGENVTLNNSVMFPGDLPKLPPGSSTVTYDNTITSLKITPRWYTI